MVLVYTDGACDPNPGKGGWGAVIIRPDETIRKISGSERKETTNNRMEMRASTPARDVDDGRVMEDAIEQRDGEHAIGSEGAIL